MSENSENILTADEAFTNVSGGVLKRAFYHRLGQHGIVPQTEKEAMELFAIGEKVTLASEQASQQQAAADESRFTKANAALDTALAEQGILSSGDKQAEANGLSTEAQAGAWELAQDPIIFKSAEVLLANQAESAPNAAEATT